MNCWWCGEEFLTRRPEQRYCREAHSDKSWEYRNRSRRLHPTGRWAGDCPTPHKITHESDEEALRHLAELRVDDRDPSLSIYLCRCGWLHVGHINGDYIKSVLDHRSR